MEGRFILARHEHLCQHISQHLNIDRNSSSGDLSAGELAREHTEHIAPCCYSYAHTYRTFSPGRPASMRTRHIFPGGFLHSVLPEHTEQIAPCRYTTRVNTWHLAPRGLRACIPDKLPRANTCARSYRTSCPGRRNQNNCLIKCIV